MRAYLLGASGHPRPWPHLEVSVPAGAAMAAGLFAAIRDRVAGYLDYDGYHEPSWRARPVSGR